jgi:DNA helicase II / ATP-dependent DNA helicase PcrA
MTSYPELYKKLNPAQRDAVDTIEGPVMVVAGPGTGKTQILTLRIANILAKTDTTPENILALTFTEAATHNMRRRLAEIIGNPAYRVAINTFHGFCNDIIKKYPEDFPRIIGSKSITDVDQVSIIESIIEENELVLLKPWGDRFLYVRDIVSAISDLKREGVTPDKFAEILSQEKKDFESIPDLYHEKGAHKGKMKGDYQKLERKILKNEELSLVYEKYQEELTKRKQYDFNDMILEVLETLDSNRNLLQILQEEHQYVLVDEHQDTNNAQNKILELLMNYHDNPNLFVVGDEKQAIFRFQGASLENFYYFKHLYPSAKLITLTENYRSTQNILDTADKLLSTAKLTASSAKASANQVKPIYVAEFSNQSVERYFIAHDIQQKIKDGTKPEEIVILYRNNRDAFPIARDLDRLGISYSIESDQDLFSHSDVQKILIILRAVSEYGNDIYVTELLHLSLFDIDPLDIYKLLKKAGDARTKSMYDFLTTPKLLDEVNLKDQKSIVSLGEKLTKWVKENKERDLLGFFEHIIRDSGLLEDMIGSPNALDRFDAVNTFFDEIRQLIESKPDATLVDFFLYIETIKKHNLFLKRKSQKSAGGRVRLMTVHKSKGQEFGHVYIINAVHGIFGGKIDRDKLPLVDGVYKIN